MIQSSILLVFTSQFGRYVLVLLWHISLISWLALWASVSTALSGWASTGLGPLSHCHLLLSSRWLTLWSVFGSLGPWLHCLSLSHHLPLVRVLLVTGILLLFLGTSTAVLLSLILLLVNFPRWRFVDSWIA